MTYFVMIWNRFKKNKLALAGLTAVFILVLLAFIGPHLNHWSYSDQILKNANQPPGSSYWFGTDSLGRDLFTRVWHGARISLLIGFVTGVCSAAIGTVYGSIAGYLGGKVDEVMMKIVETLYSVPFLLYVILIMLVLEPGPKTIIITLAIVCWLGTARIVRGQVLKLKEEEYILAADVLGVDRLRIIIRHLIPNIMGPIFVMLTVIIPEAIFAEAFLSFLGLGVSVPAASLGYLINEGIQGIRLYPWQLLYPAVLISIIILSFNLIADGLRDALDPKTYNWHEEK